MDDLVKRLRSGTNNADLTTLGGVVHDMRCLEAADEIERLRAALEPFAKMAETHGDQIPDGMFIDDYEQPKGGAWQSSAGLTVGDLRAAREAARQRVK
jgi:hypothetical protein